MLNYLKKIKKEIKKEKKRRKLIKTHLSNIDKWERLKNANHDDLFNVVYYKRMWNAEVKALLKIMELYENGV